MAEIVFSPEAIDDLRQTRTYISEVLCSEQAASNTGSNIMKRIRLLADYPEAGTPLASVVNIPNDYRFLVCGNYLAFYRYEKEKNIIFLVRVLYGQRDYMRILFGETSDKE